MSQTGLIQVSAGAFGRDTAPAPVPLEVAVWAAFLGALFDQVKLIVTTPALRDRLWADQIATQQLILRALSTGQDEQGPSFQTRVTVAACLAAASTAVLTWVESDGTPELPDLMAQAFDTLARTGPTPAR